MASSKRFAVKPDRLRWRCDPKSLGFESTDELKCDPHIIGQDRALDAIRLGLELKSRGYNIFISGLTGTGRTTAIKRMLEGLDLARKDLQDICFVFNFREPICPMCLQIPAGKGGAFKERMKTVLQTIKDFVPAAFKSDQFKQGQATILEDIKRRKNEVTQRFEKEVVEHGFSLVEVEYGQYTRPEIAPVVAGEVVSMERLPGLLVQGKLGRGDYDKMERAYPQLMEKLEEVLTVTHDLQKELRDRMSELERKHVLPMVEFILGEVQEEFDFDKVGHYLEGLEKFVMEHLSLFHDQSADAPGEHGERDLLPFEVNVVVDNAGAGEAPVLIETSPSYVNLFGTIERRVEGPGEYTADFTTIRAGSLLRANGGYLVLSLNDIFEEPYVYPALKRALKNQSHVIRGFDSLLLVPITTLKPEPVVLDVKVVLMGDDSTYQLLYEYDEEFGRIFKVKAEFDSVMPNRRTNRRKYGQFIRNLGAAENLLPFDRTGVATVLEEGARRAGSQEKLSTRFSDIGDVVREASYWAGKDGARVVRAEHVERAIQERVRRVGLIEDKIQELFDDGTILVDRSGAKVGQVNGLAVFEMGGHAFGKPARITVETGVGRTGVINIEREADMSGRVHNKAVLILEGYLRRLYAQDKPITMAASIAFEQSYSGVDGDSASSTEVYAILSSLSGVPLRQDIAVTGSVNQKGEIQPIGGVNEKIEGFYEVCRHKGLTGHQGVMIPALNVRDLMLREDVADAVAKGRFHVYAVRNIDEGIEVLTGRKAGVRRRDGHFTRGSVHDLVDEALRRFHSALRDSEDGPREKEDEHPRRGHRRGA